MTAGIRLIDFPALATLTDSSEFVGQNGGCGVWTGAQVKTFVLTEISADVDANSSAILTLQTTKASASALTALQTTVGGNSSNITSLLTTTADQASSLLTLQTDVAGNSSDITDLQTTTASQASSITTLTNTTDGHTTTLTALSAVDATMGATYNLKTDVNGQVVGFGLTNTGTTTGSGITFTTSNLKVYDGTTGQTPFEIAGGVVSIKTAAIQTASIDQFKLADGSVITAKMALNAASEAFSFYTDTQQQWQDTAWHEYISGTVVVPSGGSAYVFPRAQGFTYDGTAFVFRLYVNGVNVAQFENPVSNFAAGLQDLQTPNPQIVVLGAGTNVLAIVFQALGVPTDPTLTPKAIVGHLVGFVQKK